MANTIALFKKYIDKLDEVYKRSSLTAILDSDPTLVTQGASANEFVIPKLDMQGLGDYDRNSGYVEGSVTLTHETKKADYDRGRKFVVDAMDNEETAGVAFGRLAATFVREKVVPELDAYRFAQLAKAADTPVEETLADGAATLKAINVGMAKMDEKEVPEDSRILFITPTLLDAVRDLDTTKSREVLNAFEGRIVKVPQSRFYTIIDLKNGKLGEAAGGYAKNSMGKDINFLIVEKSAVIQFSKHTVTKVFRPEENQDSDGWIFNYRSYGISDSYDNKKVGIYCNNKAEA